MSGNGWQGHKLRSALKTHQSKYNGQRDDSSDRHSTTLRRSKNVRGPR